MFQGTIVTDSGRGWWIVEQDLTHTALFVHHSSVANHRYLHIGDRIKFSIEPNPMKPGYSHAVNVEYVGLVVAIQRSAPTVSR
jgi:cold shock CspA family protein